MTPMERKDYLARGLSLELVDKITKLENTAKQKEFREYKYFTDNNINKESFDEVSDNLYSDNILFSSLGTSMYYTMSPEDIYILKESIGEKKKRLYDALSALKEGEREFILTLFFEMNGSAAEYSRVLEKSREAVRDRKIRILRKLKKLY